MKLSEQNGYLQSARRPGNCFHCKLPYKAHQRIWHDHNYGGLCIECYQSALAEQTITPAQRRELFSAMKRLEELIHQHQPLNKASQAEFDRLLEIVRRWRFIKEVKKFLQKLELSTDFTSMPPLDGAGGAR
jgi:hypothetical protein